MKKNKHTDGPWDACHHKEHSSVQMGKYGVADIIEHRTISRDENEANARLISAAPELLEALESLLDHASSLPADICVKAANVLNKAKG